MQDPLCEVLKLGAVWRRARRRAKIVLLKCAKCVDEIEKLSDDGRVRPAPLLRDLPGFRISSELCQSPPRRGLNGSGEAMQRAYRGPEAETSNDPQALWLTLFQHIIRPSSRRTGSTASTRCGHALTRSACSRISTGSASGTTA